MSLSSQFFPFNSHSSQHSWIPKSHPISHSRFWSHANNLPLRSRIFCSCRNKMKKTNSVNDVDPHEKRYWNRVKTTFFTTGVWNSAGAITISEMISFLFILGVVQTSWARKLTFIKFSVTCAVPCCFLRCFSYMRKPKSISSYINSCTIHDRELRSK